VTVTNAGGAGVSLTATGSGTIGATIGNGDTTTITQNTGTAGSGTGISASSATGAISLSGNVTIAASGTGSFATGISASSSGAGVSVTHTGGTISATSTGITASSSSNTAGSVIAAITPVLRPPYTMDRHNGQIIGAKPYIDNVNWTKGIDQKTGKPLDFDPTRDIQTYAGIVALTPNAPLKKVCPSIVGGNNYWPSSYSPTTKLLYVPALTGCMNIEVQRSKAFPLDGFGNVWAGGTASTDERLESNLTAVDPLSQEIRKNVHLRYANFSGSLATGGGLVFLGLMDGTVAAFDDTALDELWRVNWLLGAADDLRGQWPAIRGDCFRA
jgi:hypothetical protein